MRAPFDQKDVMYLAIIGPYTLYGTNEVSYKSNFSFANMKCVSKTAQTLAIERGHFEIILKQKDSNITRDLQTHSFRHHLFELDLIEKRGLLKKKWAYCNNQNLDKPVDLELMYTKEIRQECFEPKENELK